jgi:hypothetical protein
MRREAAAERVVAFIRDFTIRFEMSVYGAVRALGRQETVSSCQPAF